MRVTVLAPALFALATVFSAGAAQADDTAGATPLPNPAGAAQPDDAARATQLFNEGRELQQVGALVEACSRFRESFDLDARVGTLLNIANCEDLAGHLLLAHRRWSEAVALAHTKGDGRATYAEERDAKVVKRMPRLSVRLAHAAPDDAVITLDGANLPASALGVAMPVDPGEHVLVAKASHSVMSRTRVTLAEREEREVTIELGESVGVRDDAATTGPYPASPPPLPPDRAAPPAARPAWMRPTMYALGALGVAGVGIGTAFAVDAIEKKNASDAGGQCAGSSCTTGSGIRLRGDASNSANISTVAFVAGGLALAGGAALLFLVLRTPAHAGSRPPLRVGVGPMSVGLDGVF